MKISAVTLALATAVSGHYLFPQIAGTEDWQYIRRTSNWNTYPPAPLAYVDSPAIRCYEAAGGTNNAHTFNIQAGSNITFYSEPKIFHPGPLSGWMAKVPPGQTAASWDGSGANWFKIYQDMPTSYAGGLRFATSGIGSVNSYSFVIPECIESGEYLLRIEHIALHLAYELNGAQFFLSCAQVKVTGGTGAKKPNGLVAFPGAYKQNDPGILVDMFSAKSYTPPGPAPFTC